MANSIEQILNLALFCRKVSIPFVVYGFGNEDDSFKLDHNRSSRSSFTMNDNELSMSNVYLREYLNSQLGNAEFNRCVRNLVALAECYTDRFSRKFHAPWSERLSHTPMIESVVAMKTIVQEFKKNNHLDIVNMALIHDGDSDTISRYWMRNDVYHFDSKKSNVVLRDAETKTDYRLEDSKVHVDSPLRIAVFNWFRKTTGVKILGFFIVGSGRSSKESVMRRYYFKDGESIWHKFPLNSDYHKRLGKAEELNAILKEKKFLDSYNPGYDSMYLIPGDKDLSVDSDVLTVDGNVTPSKLKNAFLKMNKKKQVSRVLVNRFIGQIAA
jgi:hypothetical protein